MDTTENYSTSYFCRKASSPHTYRQYKPEIDGIRAFAIVAVILNHFNKNTLPSGYLGVDMFFVISGFVITSSLVKSSSESLGIFLMGFCIRRIKRLIPALVAYIIIVSILICIFNPNPEISLKTGIAALFGFSNLYLLKQSTDYFAASTEMNVFTHTWSLGVEEQFYFVFPVLAWFVGISSLNTRRLRILSWLVSILIVTSLISFIYFYQRNQPLAYFLMPARMWELCTGCWLFLNLRKFARFFKNIPPITVITAIIIVLFIPLQLAVPSTIAIVLLTMILIVCLRSGTPCYKFFTHQSAVYIGLISYSLYLWHWGVLSLSHWTIGIHWWSIPFQIAMMLILSIASYHYIENPFRHSDWSPRRLLSIGYGLGASVISAIVLMLLTKPFKGYLYSGNYPYNELITRSRNDSLNKKLYTGDKCHISIGKHDQPLPVTDCRIDRGTQRFYFVGDSHADHFRTTHFLLAANLNVSVDGITASSCVFPFQSSQRDCGNIQQRQQKRILQEIKTGDVVVIANRYIDNDINDGFFNKTWIEEVNTIKDLLEFSRQIKKIGGRTVLIAPTPEFSLSIQECIPQWYRPSFSVSEKCHQSLLEMTMRRKTSYNILSKISSEIFIYNPSSILCLKSQCGMVDVNYKPLYTDQNHLTDYANTEFIYKDFVAFLYKHNLLGRPVD